MNKWVLCILGLTLTASFATADVVSYWDFEGVDVADGSSIDEDVLPYSFSASTKDEHLESGTLTLGFDGPSISTNMYGFKFSAATHQTSLEAAIANNHYIQFSLAASNGYVINLSNIEMYGESGSSGPNDIALMTSIDGFSSGSEIGSLTDRQDLTGGWDTDASGWGAPIDLSANEYQNLDSISFRIYGWNSTGNASAGLRDSGSDLTINGAIVAVPEPASIAIIGLGALLLVAVRRRMKS